MVERVGRMSPQDFSRSEEQEQNDQSTEDLLNFVQNGRAAPQVDASGQVVSNRSPAPTYDSSKSQGTQNYYDNQAGVAQSSMDSAVPGTNAPASSQNQVNFYDDQKAQLDKFNALKQPGNVAADKATTLTTDAQRVAAGQKPVNDQTLPGGDYAPGGRFYRGPAVSQNSSQQASSTGGNPTDPSMPVQAVAQQAVKLAPAATVSLLGSTPEHTTLANTDPNAQNVQVGDSDLSQNQRSLVGNLESAAGGNGPSMSQPTLQSGVEAGLNQQNALLQSQRGSSPISGLRYNAAMNAAKLTGAAAGKAAELSVGEQTQARTELANVLQGTRSQDQAVSMTQAQLDQQRVIADQQTALQRDLESGKITAAEFSQKSAQLSAANQQNASMANSNVQLQGQMDATKATNDAAASNKLNDLLVDKDTQMRVSRLDADTRISLANLSATLQQEGMDNDMIVTLLQSKIAQADKETAYKQQLDENNSNIASGNAVANNAHTTMDDIQQAENIAAAPAKAVGSTFQSLSGA